MKTDKPEQSCPLMTTSSGRPVGDNQNSVTAGPRGPVLMEDYLLFEKMAQFNRERIPERVVHAKGAGAHGTFTVTGDIAKYTSDGSVRTRDLGSEGSRSACAGPDTPPAPAYTRPRFPDLVVHSEALFGRSALSAYLAPPHELGRSNTSIAV